MKLTFPSFVALLALSLTARAEPVGNAFTWQGRLDHNGAPASGSFDLKFELFNVAAGGNAVGAVERFAQNISGGLFSTDLDFGGPLVFDGTAYWLAVSAKTAGGAIYVAVPGRTAIRPTPYALHALSAGAVRDGAITSNSLANGAVTSAKLSAGAVGFAQLNAPAVPNPGQLLAFDGAALSWINPSGGGGGSGPWLLNGTTAFYNAGSVGIGTTTPAHRLSIGSGPPWTSHGWVGAVALPHAAAIAWPANSAGQRFGMGHTDTGFYLFRTASNPGTITSAPTYDFVVDDSGNVGIGTTTVTVGVRLEVNGPVKVTAGGSGGFVQFGTPNGESGMSIHGGNRADIRFDDSTLKLLAGPGTGPPSSANGIAITTAGNVGIGSPNPVGKLEVVGQDALRLVGYQPFLTLHDSASGYARSRIQGADGKLFFQVNDWASPAGVRNIAVMDLNGMAVNGAVTATGNVSVSTLTIRGGADLAEPFAMSHSGVEPGSVVVIDEENPGKLKASTRAYDKKVAGIVSGANGIKPGISMIQEDKLEAGENVALSGRVYVKADTSAGPIEPGDLLTTSSTAGCAMKAADHDKAQGAIIGKAMTPLKDADGMVLVLVTLQ